MRHFSPYPTDARRILTRSILRMHAIDHERRRRYCGWLGAALTLCALVAMRAGGQLTAPLGERTLGPRMFPAPAPLQWLGDVTACGDVWCAQSASMEIALPMTSGFHLVGGGGAAHRLNSPSSDLVAERRADLRYRTSLLSAWVGAVRVDGRAEPQPSNALTGSRFESGFHLDWARVGVTMSVATGRRAQSASTRSVIIRVSDSATVTADSVAPDAGAGKRTAWSLAEVRASWTMGNVALSTVVGRAVSVQAAPSVWERLEVARPLGRGTSVFLNVGTSPAAALLGLTGTARRSIDLGLHFNPSARNAVGPRSDAAPSFVVQRASQGQYRLRVRVADAKRVELASDCTAWEPVVMSRVADGVWVSLVPAAVGPHLVNIRVDGGRWIAPPGLVPKRDDFAGSVGVFVIE